MSVMDAAFGEMFSGSRAATGFGLLMIVGGVLVFLVYGAERSVVRILRRLTGRRRAQRVEQRRVVGACAAKRADGRSRSPHASMLSAPVEPVTELIPRYSDHPDATVVLPRIPREQVRRG